MTVKVFSVSEFKAHCTEILREVEQEGVIIEVTRHGKKVARVTPPGAGSSKLLQDWMGSGAGITYTEDYDPDAPVVPDEEWDAVR
ncbi:MAG TPA: type II toxin-antitoxin system Phd/YefM family antitoxin [Chthoniobacteraceae bacterium]|nr:type II toxin-antitoxin system Phd/YefM family antitoxin [Chthoniobacteraceae bacterium]